MIFFLNHSDHKYRLQGRKDHPVGWICLLVSYSLYSRYSLLIKPPSFFSHDRLQANQTLAHSFRHRNYMLPHQFSFGELSAATCHTNWSCVRCRKKKKKKGKWDWAWVNPASGNTAARDQSGAFCNFDKETTVLFPHLFLFYKLQEIFLTPETNGWITKGT